MLYLGLPVVLPHKASFFLNFLYVWPILVSSKVGKSTLSIKMTEHLIVYDLVIILPCILLIIFLNFPVKFHKDAASCLIDIKSHILWSHAFVFQIFANRDFDTLSYTDLCTKSKKFSAWHFSLQRFYSNYYTLRQT